MARLCFDLDGPLLDPQEGFQQSLDQACRIAGLPPLECIQMGIGRDPRDFFEGLEPDRLASFATAFWTHYAHDGLFAQRVIPGAHLMLSRLKRQGHSLCAVSGYPLDLTRRALHHFDLNLLFEAVAGASSGWQPKREVMIPLAEDGWFTEGGFLVGDRSDDMEAAAMFGLVPLGAAYGFGEQHELTRAHAVFQSLGELDAWFGARLTDPEIFDPFSRSE